MAKAKILVVDDDAALAEMIGIILNAENYETIFCADGAEAVEAFRQAEPDLVLLDLMLPGKDGIQICGEIREFSDTSIVMLTAKGARPTWRAASAPGPTPTWSSRSRPASWSSGSAS